ncbi:hypothetical protein DL96DRAFT_1756050 [Flagelloscypha sp. PMI_526]|nr:hypothetical protein DL96DRAFT_1756050 [Flagelloscypha sp. PMI_526]
MPGANYMGGKRNSAKQRNKDSTSRAQKIFFKRQKLDHLSRGLTRGTEMRNSRCLSSPLSLAHANRFSHLFHHQLRIICSRNGQKATHCWGGLDTESATCLRRTLDKIVAIPNLAGIPSHSTIQAKDPPQPHSRKQFSPHNFEQPPLPVYSSPGRSTHSNFASPEPELYSSSDDSTISASVFMSPSPTTWSQDAPQNDSLSGSDFLASCNDIPHSNAATGFDDGSINYLDSHSDRLFSPRIDRLQERPSPDILDSEEAFLQRLTFALTAVLPQAFKPSQRRPSNSQHCGITPTSDTSSYPALKRSFPTTFWQPFHATEPYSIFDFVDPYTAACKILGFSNTTSPLLPDSETLYPPSPILSAPCNFVKPQMLSQEEEECQNFVYGGPRTPTSPQAALSSPGLTLLSFESVAPRCTSHSSSPIPLAHQSSLMISTSRQLNFPAQSPTSDDFLHVLPTSRLETSASTKVPPLSSNSVLVSFPTTGHSKKTSPILSSPHPLNLHMPALYHTTHISPHYSDQDHGQENLNVTPSACLQTIEPPVVHTSKIVEHLTPRTTFLDIQDPLTSLEPRGSDTLYSESPSTPTSPKYGNTNSLQPGLERRGTDTVHHEMKVDGSNSAGVRDEGISFALFEDED